MQQCSKSGCRWLVTSGSPHPDYCSHDCWETDQPRMRASTVRETGEPPKIPTLGAMVSNAHVADEAARVSDAFSWMDVRATRS